MIGDSRCLDVSVIVRTSRIGSGVHLFHVAPSWCIEAHAAFPTAMFIPPQRVSVKVFTRRNMTVFRTSVVKHLAESADGSDAARRHKGILV